MTAEYTLKIDSHEEDHKPGRNRGLINHFKELGTIPFETDNYDVGDVLIYRGDVPVVVIERKTLSDYHASIDDGRYRNQKMRLKALGCPIVYLVEGLAGDSDAARVNYARLQSSWAGLILRDNIHLLRAENFEETCVLVEKCYKRAVEFKLDAVGAGVPEGDAATEYLKTIKLEKKANVTPENALTLMLAQIPGISVPMASKVCEIYPSFQALMAHYASLEPPARAMTLRDISLGKRKMGKVASEKIYMFLYGIHRDNP